MKTLFAVFGIFCALSLCAASVEEFEWNKPECWKGNYYVTFSGMEMYVKKNGGLVSHSSWKIYPGRRVHQLTAIFRSTEKTKEVRVILGYVPFDARKRPLLKKGAVLSGKPLAVGSSWQEVRCEIDGGMENSNLKWPEGACYTAVYLQADGPVEVIDAKLNILEE